MSKQHSYLKELIDKWNNEEDGLDLIQAYEFIHLLIKQNEAIQKKLEIAVEACKKAKIAMPYWDYSEEELVNLVKAHKGNAVGAIAEAQLAIVETLAEIESNELLTTTIDSEGEK